MIRVQSTISKVETLADNSLKLSVVTQELAPESETEIFKYRNKLGWFVFKEETIKEEDLKDLPEIEPEFKGQKSPSERLRNIIWVYWDSKTNKSKPFETFRLEYMEKLIQSIKDKLD